MQSYIRSIRGVSKFGAAMLVFAIAHLADASISQPCCVVLPPAPNNEADAIVRATLGNNPEKSLFTVEILPGGATHPTPPIPPGTYAAWCFDATTIIDPGAVGTEYGGRLYSTCDQDFLNNLKKYLPPHPGIQEILPINWHQINYLINHRLNACNGKIPSVWEVQRAILNLVGQVLPDQGYPPYDPNVVVCLVQLAALNAPNWVPGPNDKIAVVYNIDVNWDDLVPDVQLIFLEVPCPAAPVCKLSVSLECLVPSLPPTTPFDCGGAKPIDTMWVRWNGSAAQVWVKAWNGAVGTGSPTVFGPVAKGAKLKFTRSGSFPNDVYFEIFSNAAMTTKLGVSTFHLSCSDDDMNGPEDCGKSAGNGKTTSTAYMNDWLFEGMGGNGQSFECTPTPPQPSTNCTLIAKPMASCETVGKPTSLTFRYTGGGCGVGNNPQSGKFICSGSVNPALGVVVASANGYSVSPSLVQPGGEFTVSAGSFSSQSLFTLTNAGGTETLSIHTSCSQPLAVGDVFGSLTLVGFNGQMGGSSITYRYTVVNQGQAALSNVFLTDNKLGPIAGPFSLAVGETKTFQVNLQVSGTVESTATVYVMGQQCAAVSNQVIVNVIDNCPTPVAPATSFACSDVKPIDSLTMQWAGNQAIGVKAYKGPVGSSALLASFNNVVPGAVITVTGYAGSPNDVYWELFAGDVNGQKLGESTFHVSCSDDDMNGPEDCGKLQGDGKAKIGYINQWMFKGMAGNGKAIDCSGATPLPKATVKDKKLLWTLANTGATKVTMTGLAVSWPAANGKLMKVKFDGDVVWDDKSPEGATSINLTNAMLTSDAKKKSIEPGDTRLFTLEFEKDSSTDLSKYTLSISFGSCVLNL